MSDLFKVTQLVHGRGEIWTHCPSLEPVAPSWYHHLLCTQAYSKSGDLAPGCGVPWTVVKTLVTILDFLNEMLVLILEVCAVSMGIPYFAKVRPTPLPFYDRPIVVPVFAE